MNRIILSALAAVSLVAATAGIAAAGCDVTVSGSVKRYWPSSGTTSYANDPRCDASGTNCHLSGWLFTPSGSGPHPAIVYSSNAGTTQSRFDTCEVVNYFVPKGYVVFVPYARGTDDTSNHSALAPGEGFHNTGVNHTAATTSLDKLFALEDEAYDLQVAVEYVQALPSVDADKVALFGAGAGGTRGALVAEHPFLGVNNPLFIDLSGAVWDWGDDPQWAIDLNDAAEYHIGAALYQAVSNESASGNYTATVSQFTYAGQYSGSRPAKLALYAGFTVSSSAQAICNNRGYGTNKCASFTFVTDADQVARWIDVVHDFLVEYGVT